MTFYLLLSPKTFSQQFAQVLQELHNETKLCSICKSIGETDPCDLCSDPQRDQTTICVVEKPLDILSLERSGKYRGLYHVLGGAISPLNNIGPDELFINELVRRLEGDSVVREVILATNANLEGEATAMYLSKLIKNKNKEVKVTRIGRGLPVGSDLEYADEVTLMRAMEGRAEY